jgi:hypothetical protein
MRATLELALRDAKELPADELPRLLGDLEEVRATAQSRLLAARAPQAAPDEWLDVKQTAELLKVSRDYLYHNHASLPFAKRLGKRLLFSRTGMERYMRRAKVA